MPQVDDLELLRRFYQLPEDVRATMLENGARIELVAGDLIRLVRLVREEAKSTGQ